MKNLIIGIIILSAIVGGYFYFGNNTMTPEQTKKTRDDIEKKISQEINIEGLTKKVQSGEMTESEMEEEMMKNLANSKTFKNEFEKQKANMPKYISLMKTYKACLEKADTESQAKNCFESVKTKAKSMGITENDDNSEEKKLENWSVSKKNKLLSELNSDLKEMEGMLSCYNTSSDMMGVMKCAEKMN